MEGLPPSVGGLAMTTSGDLSGNPAAKPPNVEG
jgi:hypothetical protein